MWRDPPPTAMHYIGKQVGPPTNANGVRIRWNEADKALETWILSAPPLLPEPEPEPEPANDEAWQPWDGQAAIDSATNAEEWGDVLRLVARAHFRIDPKAIVLSRACKTWRHYWHVAEGCFGVDVLMARRSRDATVVRRALMAQGVEGDALDQRMLEWCHKCEAESWREREAREAEDLVYRQAEDAKHDWLQHAFQSGMNNIAMPCFNKPKLPGGRHGAAMLLATEVAAHSIHVPHNPFSDWGPA